jgi:hypothetical protein
MKIKPGKCLPQEFPQQRVGKGLREFVIERTVTERISIAPWRSWIGSIAPVFLQIMGIAI